MKTIRRFLAASFVLFLTVGSVDVLAQFNTPLKTAGFRRLTTNSEVVEFVKKCDAQSNEITVTYFPLQNGLQIPVVKISRAEESEDKLKVLMIAQQHGNEPSGMEAMLQLIAFFAKNTGHTLLKTTDLTIIPQCNPTGGDRHERRNGSGIDLNRDHLLIRAEETAVIQQVFRETDPEMTVDFHEYYPYGKAWEEFGYRRNFDIQLGGLTNINTSEELRNLFKINALPYIKVHLRQYGFSFFEYTLGDFPAGERLRHSTVDINDGRQSFGITGTFSLIVEGMNGRDSIHNLERRVKSQYQTALGLLQFALVHRTQIREGVQRARKELELPKAEVAIIQEHTQGIEPLEYPLFSISTKKDTVFKVEAYHPVVKKIESVKPPEAYLIPKNDTLLVSWLKRSGFSYQDSAFTIKPGTFQYQITGHEKTNFEGIEGNLPLVEKVQVSDVSPADYYLVPVKGLFSTKIVLALEPRAMYALPSYPEFEYLISGEKYPVLRIEK